MNKINLLLIPARALSSLNGHARQRLHKIFTIPFHVALRQRFQPTQIHRCLACLLFTWITAGCGSANQPCTVEGSVTYRSKPIEKGAIRFVTEDGTPGEGGLGPIANGRYSLTTKKMIAGKYLVMISAFQDTGRKFIPEPGAPEVVEERQYLPKKFNASSTLKVNLKGGANIEDFNLTD